MTETMTGALLEESAESTGLAAPGGVQVVVFTLGDEQLFGVDAFAVREVLRRPPAERTLDRRPLSVGSCNYRGQSIPVIDLAVAFGYAPLCDEPSASLVVSDMGGSLHGFLVLGTQRAMQCPVGTLEAPDSALGFGARVNAVTWIGSALLALVDLQQVLAATDFRPAEASAQTPANVRVRRPACVLVSDNPNRATPPGGQSQWR